MILFRCSISNKKTCTEKCIIINSNETHKIVMAINYVKSIYNLLHGYLYCVINIKIYILFLILFYITLMFLLHLLLNQLATCCIDNPIFKKFLAVSIVFLWSHG